MKSAKERMDIISAYREVGSYRGAAELVGTTHKTVKRTIDKFEADQAGQSPPQRAERERNYAAVTDLVAERVDKSQGRISAKRILPIARKAGYTGSDRNFRRLVAEEKQRWRTDHHRGRRPAVWAPGDYLIIDWATVGGLHLFCAVMAYSRWRFAAFGTDEKATTTMVLIAEALATVGGVPRKVLADRMACLKGGVARERRHPHPGLRPLRCSLRVRAGLLPRERPTIERSGGKPRRLRPTRSRCPVAHRSSRRRHHRRRPYRQRRRETLVHGSQRPHPFGDMRGPERQTRRRARAVVALAIATTGDRSTTGHP